ncbi:hypothetical protein NOM73_06490 [Erwinia persicina]|uniref:TylF/MycF/NovP-related O-methyltransferase n=1 Tax=Erwinia persicina TaxID=55211 RepID=UPI00210B5817|nr:TylF/MycF/NovP-related O-methyltransferase [Erwinia persicina]MCQ4094967.1 hypothetical protein [Erwinia persicina]MCQ4100068.1 hypothetical protein [Erwinia persicina]
MRTHIDDQTSSLDSIYSDIKSLSEKLDHSHRQHRKIQFFLDIRGYLVMNRPRGDYVEYGLYRGEMMLGAYHVLGHLELIDKYVGFDNFSGEPEMTETEASRLPFIQAGDYCANEIETRSYLGSVIGNNNLIIASGDFRKHSHRNADYYRDVAVGVVDCNLESSIRAALETLLPRMISGGALFLDDYFLNITEHGPWHEFLLDELTLKYGVRLVEFGNYPPCAKAFLVFKTR